MLLLSVEPTLVVAMATLHGRGMCPAKAANRDAGGEGHQGQGPKSSCFLQYLCPVLVQNCVEGVLMSC